MEYIRLAFGYMKRRWLHLIMYAIIPALLFALTTDSTSMFNLLVKIGSEGNLSFIDVWFSGTEISVKSIIFLIFTGLVLIIFLSALCGMLERDMRLGDLSNRKFFTRVNNNFLIVIKVFLVLIIAMEFYGLITSAIIYLWIKVFSSSYAAVMAFSVVSLVIMSVIGIMMVSLGVLWCPTMVMTGLNARKSFIEALELIKGKVFRMFFALVLPLIPFYILLMISSYFKLSVLTFFLEWITNMFFIMYYMVLMFVAYFSITGTDREDLRKKKWEVND